MTRAVKQDRKRVSLSVMIALLGYGAVFFITQYLLPAKQEDIPDYSGPIEITITREPWAAASELVSETEEVRTESEAIIEPDEDESVLEEETFFEDDTYEDNISSADRSQAPAVRDTDTVKDHVPESIKSESIPFFKSGPVVEKPETFEEKAVPQVKESAKDPAPGTTLEDIPEENIFAPTEPDETLAPVQEKPEKVLPFEPSTEREPDTLAFDMDQLDELIKHGKDDSGKPQKTEPDTDPGSVSDADTSAKPGGERKDVLSAQSPQIEWDEAGRNRTLILSGPKPDIPDWVKEEGLDLKTAVSFAVTPQGNTTEVAVEESSGYPDVDAAVLETVRKMRFNPVSGSDENVTGTIKYFISTK